MKKEAILFLDTAFEDTIAANHLYKKRLYPQSIFHVYQSVEKACKYVAVRNNLAHANDVKTKIGHNSIKVFSKLLKEHIIGTEKSWKKNKDESSINLDVFYKKFHEEVLQFETTNTVNDILSLTETSLDLILIKIDSLDTPEVRSPLEGVFKDPDSLIRGLINMGIVERVDFDALRSDEIRYDQFKNELRTILDKIPEYQRTMAKLVLIASIFSNDLNLTRYPNIELKKTPSQIFDEQNILVKRLPEIINHLFGAIKTLKELNKYNL